MLGRLTISPVSNSSVQRVCLAGGLEQAVATSNAFLAAQLARRARRAAPRSAPPPGCPARSAAWCGTSSSRRRRHPGISSSLAPVSAAAGLRSLRLRALRLPPLSSVASCCVCFACQPGTGDSFDSDGTDGRTMSQKSGTAPHRFMKRKASIWPSSTSMGTCSVRSGQPMQRHFASAVLRSIRWFCLNATASSADGRAPEASTSSSHLKTCRSSFPHQLVKPVTSY